VHRILTEHGGSITVASDAGGCTFTLSFPVAKTAPAAARLR
jgi:signal transduction histidine kinase